jgi:hypothetical protein
MLCFAPVLLLGYALTMETSWHKTTNVDGVVIEAMTCEKGLGMDFKASTAGLYGLGLQYGLTVFEGEKFSLTFLPKAGLSYSSVQRKEIPMQGQFEVGAQFLGGYENYRMGLEYWHLSNAGLQEPNIGLDMLVIQTGWRF